MSYKLVVMDLDSTLLDNDHKISNKNSNVIKELMKQGILVTLASGRLYNSIEPYAKKLNIKIPLITANGSLVKSILSKNNCYKMNVNLGLSEELFNYAKKRGYVLTLYYEDEIVTDCPNRAKIYKELKENRYIYLRNNIIINKSPIKILLYHDDLSIIEKDFKKLNDIYSKDLYITQGYQKSIEIMNKKATKGKALKYLIDQLNITSDEVMVIGDGHNDITMFEVAGLAVAMENALAIVKEKADFVTKNNQDDGVAHVINKIILNKNTNKVII